jgi:hypothetical protein
MNNQSHTLFHPVSQRRPYRGTGIGACVVLVVYAFGSLLKRKSGDKEKFTERKSMV